MSLWLQAVTEALEYGEYEDFRVNLLPNAPISVPACLFREVEFAERRCRDNAKDRLFPIRFLWLMEAHEQRMFGLSPLERSCYHPEKLLELWNRVSTDVDYRQECEGAGLLFDFVEKAVKVSEGWIYIGERFVEDFLEVETILGTQLLFPDPLTGDGRPAFKGFKQPGSGGESPAEPDAEVGDDDRRH
jgi:hypothetical protein